MSPTKPKIYSASEMEERINDTTLDLPKDFSRKIKNYLGEDEDSEFGRVDGKAMKKIISILREHKRNSIFLDLSFGFKNIKTRLTKMVKASEVLCNQLNDVDHVTKSFIECDFNSRCKEIAYLRESQEKKSDSKQGMNFSNQIILKLPYKLMIELCQELIKTCKSVEEKAEKDSTVKKSTRAITNKATYFSLNFLSDFFDKYQIMPYDPNSSHDISKINERKRDFLKYCIKLISKRFSNQKINKLKVHPSSAHSPK